MTDMWASKLRGCGWHQPIGLQFDRRKKERRRKCFSSLEELQSLPLPADIGLHFVQPSSAGFSLPKQNLLPSNTFHFQQLQWLHSELSDSELLTATGSSSCSGHKKPSVFFCVWPHKWPLGLFMILMPSAYLINLLYNDIYILHWVCPSKESYNRFWYQLGKHAMSKPDHVIKKFLELACGRSLESLMMPARETIECCELSLMGDWSELRRRIECAQ